MRKTLVTLALLLSGCVSWNEHHEKYMNAMCHDVCVKAQVGQTTPGSFSYGFFNWRQGQCVCAFTPSILEEAPKK